MDRDDNYNFYEYACHEGNRIAARLHQRLAPSAATRRRAGRPNRARRPRAWARIFDRDPAVADAPPPGAQAAPRRRLPARLRRGAAARAAKALSRRACRLARAIATSRWDKPPASWVVR